MLVMLVVGALDMWRRRTSFRWGDYGTGLGMLAGAIAVLVTWFASGGWADADDPVVLIAMAVATELALRGWLVERVRTAAVAAALVGETARPVLAVLVGAVAEASLAPGSLVARLGAGAFGAGLGWLYVASGLRAPVAARLVFVMGALALQMPH